MVEALAMHVSSDLLHKTPQLMRTPELIPESFFRHGQSSPERRLRVLYAGPYFASKGMDFPLHMHTVWELHYYRAGYIDSLIQDERVPVRPGLMTLIPPNTVHGERACTDYANYFIHIDAPKGMQLPRLLADDADQSLLAVCAAIVREMANPRLTERDAMLDALSIQLGVLLQRASAQPATSTSAEQLVRQVELILEERYATSLCIKEVANEIGVSPSHLRAQFKRLRGITPMDRLQEIRLQRALSWLRHSNLTLEAIAHTCGYDSASHLSRNVKRATGCSPGTLRCVM